MIARESSGWIARPETISSSPNWAPPGRQPLTRMLMWLSPRWMSTSSRRPDETRRTPAIRSISGPDVLVEVASELIGDASRNHDQVDPAALEIGAEGPLEAVGHAPKRHHRADGHGDAEDRQQRSGLAPHQVFEQERCEVHQDASLESRRSAAKCLRTSSTNRGPFCTGAMCLVPGTISTVQLGR